MSMVTLVQPVYAIQCDRTGCKRQYRSDTMSAYEAGLRMDALEAGWALRPRRGKGSRSAPDLCPEHDAEAGAR